MNRFKWIIAVLMLSVSCPGQSLAFKGNSLGMSLTDFKRANDAGKIEINIGPLTWNGRKNKKYDQVLSLPLCTDTVNVFPGSSFPLVQDEVLCNTAPWGVEEGRTVLGEPIDAVYYRFYRGKLYSITLIFGVERFQEILSAFTEKYGKPTRIDSTAYQNAFGATWSGADATWIHGQQFIAAHEGSANGPAQNRYEHKSEIDFRDVTLAPEPEKPPPTDF